MCTLQSKQTQFTCEVRSIPATNPNRFPVVFTLRLTTNSPTTVVDPIIVSLTYFRSEFPVVLLFYAFGMTDRNAIFALVQETARDHTIDDIQRLLHPTLQHAMTVNSQHDALVVLMRSTQQHINKHGGVQKQTAAVDPAAATYDLLCANVLPHLSTVDNKCKYVAHMVGLILTQLLLNNVSKNG